MLVVIIKHIIVCIALINGMVILIILIIPILIRILILTIITELSLRIQRAPVAHLRGGAQRAAEGGGHPLHDLFAYSIYIYIILLVSY